MDITDAPPSPSGLQQYGIPVEHWFDWLLAGGQAAAVGATPEIDGIPPPGIFRFGKLMGSAARSVKAMSRVMLLNLCLGSGAGIAKALIAKNMTRRNGEDMPTLCYAELGAGECNERQHEMQWRCLWETWTWTSAWEKPGYYILFTVSSFPYDSSRVLS